MRLFLAIQLSNAVQNALAEMQTRLKQTGADVRWVDPANFHLTVKFIGDQPDAFLPRIEEACAEVAQATPAFSFCVQGAGVFPRRGPLKTLWAGLGEGANAWGALATRSEAAMAEMGVPRTEGLVPHLTLGRVQTERAETTLRAALAVEAATNCGVQTADRITLVQSVLDPRGASYNALHDWPLTPGNT